MSASSEPARIHSLDGLRGVASVVVLVLHVAMMLELWGPSAPYSLIPGTPAVIVFFVLSGVVLSIGPLSRLRAGRPYDWIAYYPRRVVRLCVPLFAAVALGVVAGYVAWRIGSTGRSATAIDFAGGAQRVTHDVLMQFDVVFNVSDDARTLLGTPLSRVNSPVWSMCWELWFSLTLPLAIACLARVRRERLTAAALFAGIFVSHWCGYFPLRLCLTFWLGVLLARHLDELSRARLAPAVEVGCLVLAVCVVELAQANAAGLLGPVAAPRSASTGSCGVPSPSAPCASSAPSRSRSTSRTPWSWAGSRPCCPALGSCPRSPSPSLRSRRALSLPWRSGASLSGRASACRTASESPRRARRGSRRAAFLACVRTRCPHPMPAPGART